MKLAVFYSLALLFLIGCGGRRTNELPPVKIDTSSANEIVLTEEQFRNAAIRVGHLEQRSISGTIKANGVLDVPPQNLVSVSAPLGGFVKKTDLLQGMKVVKGQAIVSLEHPDYIQLQQDYLDLFSQLEFQELEYQRQEALARENVNSGKALQSARSTLNSLRARVEGLRAKLQLINIDPSQLQKGKISSTIQLYSPISGYITQVNVNLGMHVSPTDVMFRIIDNSHVHAEAQVFEKDITKLRVGQVVHFTLSKDSRERTAKVYLIGKEITPERTVRVHCHIDEDDPSLIPGMYFSASIDTNEETVPSLPEGAVVNFEGKTFIFIEKKDSAHHFEMAEVKKGNTDNGYVEVKLPEHISGTASIVVGGAYELLSFLKNKEE